MKRRTAFVAGTIALMVIIGASIAIYLYQKPVKDFASSDADITVTANQLMNDFVSKPDEAQKKYVEGSPTIAVSGKIKDITVNSGSPALISLETGVEEAVVSCTLAEVADEKVRNLQKGQSVSLNGQCTGIQELIGKEVIMIRCGINQ